MEATLKNPELKKYLFFAIIGMLLIISFFIIKPFITALLSGFILAYLTKPLYKKIKKKTSENTAALSCILFVILLILIPIIIVLFQLISQLSFLLSDNSAQQLFEFISNSEIAQRLEINFEKITEQIVSLTLNTITPIIKNIPSFFMSLVIMTFTMFYSLKKWDTISAEMEKFIPFKEKQKTSKEISETTRNIFYGAISISIIEFIIMLIGLIVLGINFSFIYSTITFFFALIPGLGPAIVWIPLLIYSIIMQNWYQVIGLSILGFILSFYVDSILRSKIMGEKSKINPVIMLIGILGGISLFGIFGFIIGPLTLIYTIKLLQETIK